MLIGSGLVGRAKPPRRSIELFSPVRFEMACQPEPEPPLFAVFASLCPWAKEAAASCCVP